MEINESFQNKSVTVRVVANFLPIPAHTTTLDKNKHLFVHNVKQRVGDGLREASRNFCLFKKKERLQEFYKMIAIDISSNKISGKILKSDR